MDMYESVLQSNIASKLAYIPMRKNNKRFKIIHNKKSDVRVFIHTRQDQEQDQVVAFRGSHDIQALLRFLNFKMDEIHMQDKAFHVHSGVIDMFKSIEPELTNHLFPSPITFYKPKTITFTGHSGGAAMAMFASVYYASIIKKNLTIKCHMFGCPKVGDNNFVKFFLENTHESVDITNEHDIVQHIPFGFKYDHNPKKIILMDNSLDPLYSHDLDTYKTLLKDKTLLEDKT